VVAGTLLVLLLALAFVVTQALQTLDTLTIVERERDTWQRPDDILRHLNAVPGSTVVDLGSGAGYFTLKIAQRVEPGGSVLAVDLRRQSLAFLWYRAWRQGYAGVKVIRSEVDNPKLPPGPLDAVLIANTYHELMAPDPILRILFASMRQGARLVVVDRGPRDDGESRSDAAAHHELTAATAEAEITSHGFQVTTSDHRFIDRAGDDDIWWLIVFRKP